MEGTQTGLIGQVVHFFKSLRVDKYQRNRLMALEYFLPSWDSQKGFQSKLKSGNSAPSLSETADEMSLVINRYERLLYRTINHWQIRDEQNKLFEASF